MDKRSTRRRSQKASASPQDVAEYSIRLASRLTGLPPDTLRVWERRYGFPNPRRTDHGTRTYSRDEVQALQLIVRVLKVGYRPGEVVGKSRRELERLLGATMVAAPEPEPTSSLDALFRAIVRDDVVALRMELQRAALALGPRKFITHFAYPASVRIGDAWQKGALEVRHEHLFSASLSRLLHVMISAFDESQQGVRVLLATLPNENHGLGLDMIGLYLAAHGMVPRVLGIDTPPEQIARAALAYDCNVVGVSVTGASSIDEAQAHLRVLLRELPKRMGLWVGGAGARHLRLDPRERAKVSTISDFASLDAAMAMRSGAATRSPAQGSQLK